MGKRSLAVIVLSFLALCALSAQTLTDAQKAKVEASLKSLQSLGSDPTVVKAVKDYNAKPPAQTKGMTQDRWDKLSVLDPIVKGLASNPLATYLKTKRTAGISELFVSGADGTKVAFFGKTSSWSHKGKPKHDVPMTRKTWIGEPEMDASTGKLQVQVSFPVLDAGKAIGSIVIGLDVSKL